MLRNKEFRRFGIAFLALTAILTIIGFVLTTAAGVLALVTCAVLGATFFIFTKARYNGLSRISQQIDLVLHNVDRMNLGEFDEGELSILHNEITKMTLRIREQNDALRKDKQYLADSLADIAHQLRTPLTSANLILSLLEKSNDEEERQGFVRELTELLVKMDWLITSLLKLSRLDAGVVEFQRVPVDMSQLIASALRPLAIPMELRNIDLKINIATDAAIQGDAAWLCEAIQNILKNCMESAGENGKIEVHCATNTLYTELLIHDSGAGFSQEDLTHIFDRFYKGSNSQGYGIGLSLSKMIIARQGGRVTAKNHASGGAAFTLRFPKVTNQSL
jgi:signal transduction histidine kinase